MLLIFFRIDGGSYIIYVLYLDENKNLKNIWNVTHSGVVMILPQAAPKIIPITMTYQYMGTKLPMYH